MKTKKFFFLICSIVFLCFAYSYIHGQNVSISRFLFNRRGVYQPIHITPKEYLAVKKRKLPKWMHLQIEEDLKTIPRKTLPVKETLKVLNEKGISCFYIQVKNNKLVASNPNHVRVTSMIHGIKLLLNLTRLPDFEAIICFEDSLSAPDIDLKSIAPIFVFAKQKGTRNLLLLPDFSCFANSQASYALHTHITPLIEKHNDRYPWEKKQATGLWRGATTGVDFTSEKWYEAPRIKLCLFSTRYPCLLNAKFSHFSQMPSNLRPIILKVLPAAGFLMPHKHLHCKYLINVDGNSCTYPGLHWRLLSNSLVIKQETNNIQWYYKGLKRYTHYLPLRSDLSDLKDKLIYAREHDAKMKEIAQNATEFAEESLSLEANLLYLDALFKRYAKIGKKKGLFDSI